MEFNALCPNGVLGLGNFTVELMVEAGQPVVGDDGDTRQLYRSLNLFPFGLGLISFLPLPEFWSLWALTLFYIDLLPLSEFVPV